MSASVWGVQLMCFGCGQVTVPSAQVCVVINDDDRDSGCVFVCPICETDVVQRAPVAVLEVLAAAGACVHDTRLGTGDAPPAAVSPLTLAHVEDLIRRITSVEYLAAHAAREIRYRP